MKIDSITGNVTATNYQGWIELHSLHFNINRSMGSSTGHPRQQGSHRLFFSDLTISKRTDETTHHFFQHICSHSTLPSILIHACYTDTQLTPHTQYTLEDSFITHIDTQTTNTGCGTELITIQFNKIITTFIGRDNQNQQQSPQIAGFNLETQQLM